MSGALAERVFVAKLHRVGFEHIEVRQRTPIGLDRTAGYPLFTPDLVELMYRLIPRERHDRIATSVIVTATKPAQPV